MMTIGAAYALFRDEEVGSLEPGKEIDRMIDIIAEINLKYNVLISVYPVSAEDYLTLKTPLLMNARKEGVPA